MVPATLLPLYLVLPYSLGTGRYPWVPTLTLPARYWGGGVLPHLPLVPSYLVVWYLLPYSPSTWYWSSVLGGGGTPGVPTLTLPARYIPATYLPPTLVVPVYPVPALAQASRARAVSLSPPRGCGGTDPHM